MLWVKVFFFILKHSWAPKRSWKISHAGPGKVLNFFLVKVWEPCVTPVKDNYAVSHFVILNWHQDLRKLKSNAALNTHATCLQALQICIFCVLTVRFESVFVDCAAGNVVCTSCWWDRLSIASTSFNKGVSAPAISNVPGYLFSRLATEFTACWDATYSHSESNFMVSEHSYQRWFQQTPEWTSDLHWPSSADRSRDYGWQRCPEPDWKCSASAKCQQLSDVDLVASRREQWSSGGCEAFDDDTVNTWSSTDISTCTQSTRSEAAISV